MTETTIQLTPAPDGLAGVFAQFPQAIEGDWAVFTLRSFGANVKRGNKPNETTVWATLETPSNQVLRLAMPLHPGAGPQPANTVTVTTLHDMVLSVVQSLEWVLEHPADQPKGDKEW